MTELTLNRPKEHINRLRSYSIIIDDEHVTDLENNSRQTLSLDKNEIAIKAKLAWCGSKPKQLPIDGRNTLTLNVQGNKYYGKVLSLFGLLLIAEIGSEYLLEGFQTTISIIHMLSFVAAIYITYILTVEKDSWITITEA